MVSTFIGLLDIQSWWEIPCIAHFCSLFSSAFNLPDIDIEDLESALLTDGTEDTVSLLPDLIVSLLKGCDALKNRDEITTSNYQMFLRRFLRQQCRLHNTKNYFDTDIDFQSLPLRNKLLILYSLCHFRLESSNVQKILANLEADSLRVEPLGYDSKNSGYWYFYGTRLYREDTKPGGKSTVWQVICFTEEDWSNLASKLKSSTSPKERALFKILTENFIPKLPQLFRERERLRRRKLLQVRSSARINTIVEEKQKQLTKKQEAEEIQRRKIEEELKLQAANKWRTRSRRRSQSSSTASGISTYASSIRASTPSSEFLTHHETFCLSPGLGDVECGEGFSPKYQTTVRNSSCANTKGLNVDYISDEDDTSFSATKQCETFEEEKTEKPRRYPEFPTAVAKLRPIAGIDSDDPNDEKFDKKTNYPKLSKRSKRQNIKISDNKSQEKSGQKVISGGEGETEIDHIEGRNEMAPTTNIKLPGRQTNNSLSSIPENIFLTSVVTNTKESKNSKSKSSKSTSGGNTKSKEKDKKEDKKTAGAGTVVNIDNCSVSHKKKKNKSAETYTEKDEILQIGMHKVLLYVKNHRDAWPFMDPVDEEIAPRYYSIIRRPMDLLKMEEKLDNEEYKKYSEFRNDFKLIVNNCRLYNGQNNEYTEMVNNLQEAFDKATKKYLDQHSSDEDESFEYPDPRTNVFREKSFNKANAPVAQKEVERDINRTNKEGMQSTSQHEDSDVPDDKDIEKSPENRAGKKKRKDKDKRRKKKSKAKPQIANTETDVDENITEHSAEESDSASVTVKSKKRLHEKSKSKNVEPPLKRVKMKASQIEDDIEKEISEKKTKKSVKTMKQSSKAKTSVPAEHMDLGEYNRESDAENVSDSEGKDEKSVNRSRNNSKRKHSPPNEKARNQKKKVVSSVKDATSSGKPDRPDKHDQNSKLKHVKSSPASVSKESDKKDNSKASQMRQPKDNKKNTTGHTKNRKGGRRKVQEAKENNEETIKAQAVNVEQNENEESFSRSSSPLFKVDLHEKYAKSASIKDDESSCDGVKRNPGCRANDSPKKANADEDLMSITSQSLSRSASPFNSFESDVAESEKSKGVKSNIADDTRMDDMVDDVEKSTSSTTDPSTSSSYFYLDKYDLIKQRRNRNTEEKWNQIVKEAEKMKDTKKAATSDKSSNAAWLKEKNQKLKETIEKLKVKNAKSKERSVLIDEIFGVKPTQQPRDEKTILDKLRESNLESKSPPSKKSILAPAITEAPKVPTKDAYDFVDDEIAPSKAPASKKQSQPIEQPSSISSKKSATKKEVTVKAATKKGVAVPNKTNMEALELETEQTLKDINRWLEHTPRFPEFSSASNSPSRYNLLDDFDAVASKIDPNDFRRPGSVSASKLEVVGIDEIADNNKQEIIEDLIPPVPVVPVAGSAATASSSLTSTSASLPGATKSRESSGTTQFLAHPPPPPHVKSQQQKDSKRKTLKEKLTGINRRKDILRTIDRLQPGKAKGNLISAMHGSTKTEELFPPAATNKIKEVKNSLVVKTDESGPKLSMGSVLQTETFGLGHLHNFADSKNENKVEELAIAEKTEVDESSQEKKDTAEEEVGMPKKIEMETPSLKAEKLTATPNLSAWFKAFGTPKKAKKAEEEEKKAAEAAAASEPSQNSTDRSNAEAVLNNGSLSVMKSPPSTSVDTFSLPAPRQRKASTGSTVSERSSFSQDPDSPRVGIDDRFGAYTGPYPSPIGASPIMVSPKPDEIGKPTSPYPLNGAIKVGFYQDTTTKSSPEKSCSPRELPSPYPQYSQHLYSSASSPTVNTDAANTFASCYNSNSDANKSQGYTSTPASTLFEQYKQPRSQESDYNSMSPNTNSNSPYQQPQNSPYQQAQNSPYQQQNSPYQQPQNSPFQNQNNATILGSSPNSPNMPQTPQAQSESPSSHPNSPYHQQTNSPYQQPTNSPYHQNSTPPYQATPPQQPQQTNLGFMTQQQSTASSQPNQSSESIQRQPPVATNSSPYRPEPSTYSMHDSAAAVQYQAPNRATLSEFDSSIAKQNTNTPTLLNKLQQGADWSTQIDLSIGQTHHPERNTVAMSTVNTMPHVQHQLNTPALHSEQQMNQMQVVSDKAASMHYQQYSQFESGVGAQKESPKPQNLFGNLSMDMTMGMQRQQEKSVVQSQQQQANLKPAQHETSILNLGPYTNPTNRHEKSDQSQHQIPDKEQYESLQKHQQMFDSFLGSMAANKNLGLGKSLDIPVSKAFEMFNRASSMGFSKDFTNPLITGHQKVASISSVTNTQQTQNQQSYHMAQAAVKNIDASGANSMTQGANKPLNMASNYQQLQQHISDNVTNKMSTFPTPMSDPASDINRLHQNPTAQQMTATNYSSTEKMSNEGMSAANSRQEAMSQLSRQQQLNMDLAGYKTYNNPASMLDPLRNLNHPLSMMDDSLLGLSGSPAPTSYYEKNIPPAAHMFSKNLSQQMYSNASPYGAPSRDQQIVTNAYGSTPANNVNTSQPMENFETKQTKRKKKKTVAPTTTDLTASNASVMLPTHQQQSLQAQNPQSTQGFQLYSDLKTGSSSSATTDTSAISLKTASSMVPGSAFNFGPSPAGLGLPTGMYADNTSYLDPYYLSSSHRATSDGTNDKANSAATASAAATPYQFLAHNPVRPTYPFMNSQLDPNSPIYQQYIQRQEQELRARMMINQGLLGSSAATPGSYGQPGYRPPTLGMPKHYDMSRQTWF